MESSRPNVGGSLIHRRRDIRDRLDSRIFENQFDLFRRQERGVLTHKGIRRLRENPNQIVPSEARKLYADRKAAL